MQPSPLLRLATHADMHAIWQIDADVFGEDVYPAFFFRQAMDLWPRSEEHTSELQSHVSISYAVFCLKKIFFNDTATTEIYTLSLHDALPIWRPSRRWLPRGTDQ